jgi:hypothetical protein
VATTDGGFLAGVTSRSGANGNKISSPRGEADYWTLRLDANGQKLWEESYGGTGDDSLAVVLQTSDGGYLVAGSSESPISGNKTSPLVSNSDLGAVREGWLVKLGPGTGCITDSDGDGVPDSQDLCPNTPPGSIVNAHGCGLAQLCPCDGSWRNHADYVRCVIEDAWQFYRHGLLTAAQRHDAIRIAARSHCGQDEGVHIFLQPETRAEIQQDGLRLIFCGNLTGDCVLECTTDLVHWIPIQTNTAPALEMEIADPTAGQAQTRFYRVRLQP